MGVSEPFESVEDDCAGLFDGKWGAVRNEHLLGITAGEEFRCQVRLTPVGEGVQEPDNVWVHEVSGDAYFTMKHLERPRIHQFVGQQLLHRDNPAGSLVPGLVDHPHAALANLFQEQVSTRALSHFLRGPSTLFAKVSGGVACIFRRVPWQKTLFKDLMAICTGPDRALGDRFRGRSVILGQGFLSGCPRLLIASTLAPGENTKRPFVFAATLRRPHPCVTPRVPRGAGAADEVGGPKLIRGFALQLGHFPAAFYALVDGGILRPFFRQIYAQAGAAGLDQIARGHGLLVSDVPTLVEIVQIGVIGAAEVDQKAVGGSDEKHEMPAGEAQVIGGNLQMRLALQWAKSLEHPGRSRLQTIVATGIGLPLIQLISEPVAAAAYYAHRYQQDHAGAPLVGNVPICDMGGGTFDVTLCRIEPGKIEELHNDGNGRVELGKAGVRFDRRLIQQGLKRKGQELDDNSPDFHELYIKLQDFKVNNHRHITEHLINAIEDEDLWDKVILRAGRLTFSYRDIQAAFQEIGDGITEVLGRFKAVINDKGYPVNMVFFVGGFSEFYLVRERIKQEVLNLTEDSPRLIEELNQENVRYAISCGAALVANELIAVEEKFEHTIGVVGYVLKTIGDGMEMLKETQFLPVIKGGGRLSDYQDVHWADKEIKMHEESPEVLIYLDPESKNRVIRVDPSKLASIKLPNFGLAANQWRVGMRINRSKVVYLVFEDARGNRVECELGDIVRQVFCGIEIVD